MRLFLSGGRRLDTWLLNSQPLPGSVTCGLWNEHFPYMISLIEEGRPNFLKELFSLLDFTLGQVSPQGFPGGSLVKNLPAITGDVGAIPGKRLEKGKNPWRRKWQPTPLFLSGKSLGQRSLAGCSPWGSQESQTRFRDQTTTKCLLTLVSLCGSLPENN